MTEYYMISQGNYEYLVNKRDVMDASITVKKYIELGYDTMPFSTSIGNINMFVNWLNGNIIDEDPYTQLELAHELESIKYLEDIILFFNIRQNPDLQMINNLPDKLQYNVFLRIPIAYVDDRYTTLTTKKGEIFLKKWVEINKNNLDFGDYKYMLVEDDLNTGVIILEQRLHFIKHGMEYSWYEGWKKCSQFYYVNGKEQGNGYYWYDNGRLQIQEHYIDGKKEGDEYNWYRNGQKIYHHQYDDGKKDGHQYSWYENGGRAKEEIYSNGVMEEEQYWDEDGNIKYQANYYDETKISEYFMYLDGILNHLIRDTIIDGKIEKREYYKYLDGRPILQESED